MGMKLELKIPEELFELSNKEFGTGWMSDKVVIKRFVYGDTLSIQRGSMKVKATNATNASAEINPEELQLSTILKGVIEAPWGINDASAIRNLPSPVAEWVRGEIEKFNTLEVKKKNES